MKLPRLLFPALIGAVASARSMTPMASLAAARLLGYRTPGRLALLNLPVFRYGALALGIGELLGDKMTSAPDRTVALGLLARTSSAGIAGAALAPRGRRDRDRRSARVPYAGGPQARDGADRADAERPD